MDFPDKKLTDWFKEHMRSLPWREDRAPYRVWISEVMLQQTRADVVVPYFHRWMEAFPSVETLSRATSEEVLKMWEGLGYYSRARSIHEASRQIVQMYGGQLPSSREKLLQLPGIGPYTAGAILAFAFRQPSAAVDGNVMRVLSRFFAIEEVVCIPKTQKVIWQKAEALLPQQEPWAVSEGLIELGALVCTPKPRCSHCPLRLDCTAHRLGMQHELPRKKPRKKATELHRMVAVVRFEEQFLIERRAAGEVMADLCEFPYIELQSSSNALEEAKRFASLHALSAPVSLTPVRHTFTRFKAHLYPYLFYSSKELKGEWVTDSFIKTLPFSSGHRRILQEVLS